MTMLSGGVCEHRLLREAECTAGVEASLLLPGTRRVQVQLADTAMDSSAAVNHDHL